MRLELRRALGGHRYQLWFEHGTSIERRGHVFEIGTSNAYAMDWIERSFRGVLDEMIDSPTVPADIVASAKLNMERLHGDLTALAAQARATAQAVRPPTVHRAAAASVAARPAAPSAAMAAAVEAAATALPATPPLQPAASLPQLGGELHEQLPLCHAVAGPPRPVLRIRQKLRPAPYLSPAAALAALSAAQSGEQQEDGT